MQQLQATMAKEKCLKLVLEATPEANLNTIILDSKVMHFREHFGVK